MSVMAFNCLHWPANDSTSARLQAIINTDYAFTKLLACEAAEKRREVVELRWRRRWAQAMLRQHRAGLFDLPSPK